MQQEQQHSDQSSEGLAPIPDTVVESTFDTQGEQEPEQHFLPEGLLPSPEEPRPLSPERKAEIFNYAIERGVEKALSTIRDRFENLEHPDDRLEFHNTFHTESVVRRISAIIDAVREVAPTLCDERSQEVGRFAAAHHDIVQGWEPASTTTETPDGAVQMKILRKRFAGMNEEKSADEAIALMDTINTEAGEEIFTDSDKAMIRNGHEATIPGFDPEKGTVIQPKLEEHSALITRAIALADLGTAGMDGPGMFLPEGDALFREENLDIAEAIKHPERITETQKEFYRTRMLGWSAFQPKFAEGRRALFEKELGDLPEEVQKNLAKLFDKFDDSIDTSRANAERRASLSLEDLAIDMGYTLGTPELTQDVMAGETVH